MTVFGPEFIAGSSALVILACAQLVTVMVGSVGLILVMSGKQNLMMYNTLGICLFNILLNYLLIPPYGIMGAAVASTISIIIFHTIMLLEVYAFFRIHPYNKKFFKPVIIGIVTYSIFLFGGRILSNLGEVERLLIFIPLFLLTFTLLIFGLRIDDEDRLIIGIFKTKLSKIISRNAE